MGAASLLEELNRDIAELSDRISALTVARGKLLVQREEIQSSPERMREVLEAIGLGLREDTIAAAIETQFGKKKDVDISEWPSGATVAELSLGSNGLELKFPDEPSEDDAAAEFVSEEDSLVEPKVATSKKRARRSNAEVEAEVLDARIKVLDELSSSKEGTSKQLQVATGCGKVPLFKALKELIAAGIVKSEGKLSQTKYSLVEVSQ